MHVKGWVKSSLIDYPERIAASLFCGGCNLRCPHCQNGQIVVHPDEQPDIPESEIWTFLQARHGLLDGVVISGGEPTLEADLASFAARLHEMGFLVKLDTNGYLPDVLEGLIAGRVVDYVAMDIKAPPDKYALAAGVHIDLSRIERSIELLRQEKVLYEFRTTVVPGVLAEQEVTEIARWIAGARRYYLQQFVAQGTLDPGMLTRKPHAPQRLEDMATAARKYLPYVAVRGI
jgi:pyruvate formate lyase activating enzyme